MSGTSPIFGDARLRRERAGGERSSDSWITPPAEGWLALLALLAMLLTVALAVDGAAWAGLAPDGRSSQTGFLPVAAALSVLFGTALSKSRLGILRGHLVGAVAGGLYLIVAISGSISAVPDLFARLRALNISVATWMGDVLVLGIRSAETSVFLLVLGALMWGAGHFAAFAVFRRQRPLPAITLAGVILLVNVSITARDQYVHLIVFCAAALALLVRLRLVEKIEEWRARGMGDMTEISTSFIRGATIFIALVVVGSTTLAANGRSNALAPAWRDVDDRLIEFGYTVNMWLGGVSGETRGPNVLLAPTQTIRDFWEASDDIVFTTESDDPTAQYWQGAAYDSFDGRTWQQTERHLYAVGAGEDLRFGTADDFDRQDRREVLVSVTPRGLGGSIFVAPDGVVGVDQPAEVLTFGEGGPFVGGRLAEGMQEDVPYTVTAMVRQTEGEAAVTGTDLAMAGVEYPSWARQYGLAGIREGTLTDLAYSTANTIVRSLPISQRDPYHIALATQNFLFRNGGFRYAIDIRGLCGASDVVDCFLRIKAGYCEQFATTMVMLLRVHDIPARYVVGFLPGTLHSDGTREVTRAAAHAWVEVYFPEYGWIKFDPTPGNQAQGQVPTNLPEDPGATQRPDYVPPTPFFRSPETDLGPDREGSVPPLPPGGSRGGTDMLVVALLAMVLLSIGLMVLAALIRRAPTAQPEIVYGGVTRLARRLGHGPRPHQTAYEFADGLGVLVPPVRSDLRLIAAAKVEATYAGRPVDGSVLSGLVRAYRRVRVGLLRLVVRRPRWLRRPRGLRGTRPGQP